MSVFDVGYRSWTGHRAPASMRWITIATTGIALVWRGNWFRWTAMLTWLPVFVAAAGFFGYEQSIIQPQARRNLARFISRNVDNPELAALVLSDPGSARHEVWSTILMTFFRYPQADRKSTRLNSSHGGISRMPSSA